MKSWNIISQSVTGPIDRLECYSMPGITLFVQIPGEESVNKAKQKIEEILNG